MFMGLNIILMHVFSDRKILKKKKENARQRVTVKIEITTNGPSPNPL